MLLCNIAGARLMPALLIELVHHYGNEYQLTAEEPLWGVSDTLA